MKQSKRLISERRVRAYIFETFDDLNPDNKPREVSQEVFDALDEVLQYLISDQVCMASCENGRLNFQGFSHIRHLPG